MKKLFNAVMLLFLLIFLILPFLHSDFTKNAEADDSYCGIIDENGRRLYKEAPLCKDKTCYYMCRKDNNCSKKEPNQPEVKMECSAACNDSPVLKSFCETIPEPTATGSAEMTSTPTPTPESGPIILGPTPDFSKVPCHKAYWSLECFSVDTNKPWCFKGFRESLVSKKFDVCPDLNFCYDFEETRIGGQPLCLVYPTPIANKLAPCAKYEGNVCVEFKTSLFDTPIKLSPGELIRVIFLVVIGIAGGVAVLMFIIAGYKILTSRGKPEAIQDAREQLTSAIVGLLFIIFSYVLFQFLVVDLLKIPGIK